MFVFKTVQCGLAICASALITAVLLIGVSGAEEIKPTVQEQPVSEAAIVASQPQKETEENVRVTPTGTYHRIDANSFAYYEKPNLYRFLLRAPLDVVDWLKDSFQQKNALTIAALTVATGALIAVDQDLVRGAQDVGHSLNISGSNGKLGRAWPGSPIQYPTDFGTALYYLGDGMIPITITAGMFGYGLATSDVRTLQTSSQLAEGLLSVAIVTQTLKRITGRESPDEATRSGGTWRFFPSFKEFGSNTPKYDAFPSGHLATGMMTITVLADNYPEHTLIRPIGYTLMGLLGFQMMNNGVHWISDYPLALAIGYGLGKVAVSHGRKVISSDELPQKTSKRPFISELAMIPMPIENGGALFAVGKF